MAVEGYVKIFGFVAPEDFGTLNFWWPGVYYYVFTESHCFCFTCIKSEFPIFKPGSGVFWLHALDSYSWRTIWYYLQIG